MTAVLAWVWAPILLYLVCAGTGLLATRVLRVKLPPALVAPVGLALGTIVMAFGYRVVPAATVPVLLLLALAGLLLARGELRERLWDPLALASALFVYVLYLAPVLATGEATWAGYNFVNDTAPNFILADTLAHHGFSAPSEVSATARTAKAFVGLGYPVGSFTWVGGMQPLTGAPIESIYQPVISVFAAFGALSLTELGRRAGLGRLGVVAAAVLPLAGVLTYRYALQGSIKEIMLVTLVLAAVAVGAVAAERRLAPPLVALVLAIVLAAVLAFSVAAGAYALVLGVVMVIWAKRSEAPPSNRYLAKLIGGVALAGLIVLLPTLGSAVEFAKSAGSSFAASGGDPEAQLGQLVRPLPIAQAAGVWLSGDYRYPAVNGLNAWLIAAMLLASAGGVVWCAVRRRLVPLGLLLVLAVPVLVLAPRSSPYIDAKLLVVGTPAVVFLAVVAVMTALAAAGRLWRGVGVVGLVLVVAGLGASVVYGYRDVRYAPLDRMHAMEDVAKRIPHDRLALFNEWEEFGKFFMRSARINPAAEFGSPRRVKLLKLEPTFGRWFDLDDQQLVYVNSFRAIVTRRSPSASRPPADFRLAYRNRYYELWLRGRGPRVVAHLPLQRRDLGATIPTCSAVRNLALDKPGYRVVAAQRPELRIVSPLTSRRPAAWVPSADPPGAITPAGAGSFVGRPTASGLRRVWLRTSTARPLEVFVDGRRVGRVKQVNTPGQWLEVGTVRLGAGPHRVEVRRPESGLRPGEGVTGYIGSLGLEAVGPSRLVTVRPADAQRRLCGRRWDWLELVRP